MASVDIAVGGHSYAILCRDGDEDHLRALGSIVAGKAEEARGAVGDTSEARQLLMAALLLADDLNDARSGAPVSAPADNAESEKALDELAARMEEIAARLEKSANNP